MGQAIVSESAAPGTLAAALAAVPDPRRPRGWHPEHPPLPLGVLLQICVAAMLCGARSLSAIAQWGREVGRQEPALLGDLGVPAGQRGPCVATLHRVFKALDVAAFERAVGDWLAQTGVAADEALALDGKTLSTAGAHGSHTMTVRPPQTPPVADAWRAMPRFARAASNLSAAAPLEPAKEQEHLGTCDS